MCKRWNQWAWCATVVAATASGAVASVIDLTPGPGSSGVVNGALFEFHAVQPAGTGVFNPFVRIRESGTEQGYNTSASSLPFNEVRGPWTHDLRLGEVPVVNVGGVDFLEFILDINEPASNNKKLLSLDAVQIYTSPAGGQNTRNVASLGALRYDLDALENSHVLMDYTNAAGSGQSDVRALIPAQSFAGAAPDDFLYLYSKFGVNASSGGGFEEWGVVPEPASVALALGGLLPLIVSRRRINA